MRGWGRDFFGGRRVDAGFLGFLLFDSRGVRFRGLSLENRKVEKREGKRSLVIFLVFFV